jgi:penicillin-binding protein 1A
MNPLDEEAIGHTGEPASPKPTGEGGLPRPKSKLVLRVARNAGLIALFVVAGLLGTVGGVLFAFSSDIPEVSALDSYQPHTITRLLARDERVIGEFAIERRIVIGYNDMAPVLRQAIIATEDGEFEQHFGLSISRIVITAFKDMVYGQRFGASTITQQLARGLFLSEYMNNGVFVRSGWPLVERKMKEMLVSVQLERRYTKAEILTLYANQINLGHGAYGVEAASRMYFDKSAKDLTLEEAATFRRRRA